MNDLQQLMLISAASRTADAHAEKQSRMIKEQSRAADAAEASKREIAKRAELEQQRYDEERARRDRVEGEKLRKEKWLQAQKLALTSIEGNLKSGSRSKDDLLKVVKTAHFFQLYSDNPFEEMDWLDRCNAFQGLLRDSIDEHKSEFTKILNVNRAIENELKTEIELFGEIIGKETNERLNNFYHSRLRELKSNLRRLIEKREEKKRQEEAKKKAAEQRAIDEKKAAEQRAIDEKKAAEQRAYDQKVRAEEALRVETGKRQKERDEWNPTLARFEEQDLENYDRLTQVDFIARKIVAVLVTADGEVTPEEKKWINELWGQGALDQILLLASSVKGDELNEQIKEFCKSVDVKALAHLWVVANNAQELIESDGEVESETEAFDQIKDSILSAKNKKKLKKAADKNAGEINSSNSDFIYVDFLLRRVAAFIIAADGSLSNKEREWVEGFWGFGSTSQVLAFSKNDVLSALLKSIRKFCEKCDEEYCRWLWVVTYQFEELISADGHMDDLELSTLWMVQDAICGLSYYEYTP